jgi:hypothetical protein
VNTSQNIRVGTQVCDGSLSLVQAQQEIASDWHRAYQPFSMEEKVAALNWVMVQYAGLWICHYPLNTGPKERRRLASKLSRWTIL